MWTIFCSSATTNTWTGIHSSRSVGSLLYCNHNCITRCLMSMFVLQFVLWKCLELNASCLHFSMFRTRLRFICGDLTGLSPALFPVIRKENLRKKFLRTRNLKVMATRLCMRIKWVVRRSVLMETNCYKTDTNIRKSNSSNKGHRTQDKGHK